MPVQASLLQQVEVINVDPIGSVRWIDAASVVALL